MAVLFVVGAIGRAIVLLLVRGSLPGVVGRVAYLAAVALYAVIAVIAAVSAWSPAAAPRRGVRRASRLLGACPR